MLSSRHRRYDWESETFLLLRTCVQMGLQATADYFIHNVAMSSETEWLSSQLACYSGWVDTGAGLINPEETSSLEKILMLWDSGFGGNKRGHRTYASFHIQRQQSRMERGQIVTNHWNNVSARADLVLISFSASLRYSTAPVGKYLFRGALLIIWKGMAAHQAFLYKDNQTHTFHKCS